VCLSVCACVWTYDCVVVHMKTAFHEYKCAMYQGKRCPVMEQNLCPHASVVNVMSHIMSRVTNMNTECRMYKCVVTHVLYPARFIEQTHTHTHTHTHQQI